MRWLGYWGNRGRNRQMEQKVTLPGKVRKDEIIEKQLVPIMITKWRFLQGLRGVSCEA